ncbi:MAG: hypothetical protein HQL59_08480 [Magnetococcales bacterium]|nr:hypothetical protein [Magnetococcales bacterium]
MSEDVAGADRGRGAAGWRWSRWDTAFLILAAFYCLLEVVSFAKLMETFPDGYQTELYYVEPAANLLHHGAWASGTYPDLEPITVRPPGYSLLLAGFFAVTGDIGNRGALAFNHILLAVLLLATYALGRSWSPAVGFGAVLLLSLDFVGLLSAGSVHGDVPFALFCLLFIFLVVRLFREGVTLLRFLLATLALLAAVFVRPAGVFVWLVFILSFVGYARGRLPPGRILGFLLVFMVVYGGVIGGWMARNYAVSGNSDFAGVKWAPLMTEMWPGMRARMEKKPYMSEEAVAEYEGLLRSPEYLRRSKGEREAYMTEQAMERILPNFFPYGAWFVLDQVPTLLGGVAESSVSLFYGADAARLNREFRDMEAMQRMYEARPNIFARWWMVLEFQYYNGLLGLSVYALLFKILSLFVFFMSLAGVWLLVFRSERSWDRVTGWFCFFYVALMIATASTNNVQTRFRMPIIPVMDVLAVYALFRLRTLAASRWGRGGAEGLGKLSGSPGGMVQAVR